MKNKGVRSPWKNGTTMAIIIFVALFVLVGSIYSNTAKAETFIHLSSGATFVGGERYDSEALLIVESFQDKYEIGLSLQLRLDCRDGNPCSRGYSESPNQSLFIQRVVKYKDFQMGIGISYDHNQSPAYNTNTPFVLSMKYDLFKDFSIAYWHKSCGGICSSNGGLDFISIGYKF